MSRRFSAAVMAFTMMASLAAAPTFAAPPVQEHGNAVIEEDISGLADPELFCDGNGNTILHEDTDQDGTCDLCDAEIGHFDHGGDGMCDACGKEMEEPSPDAGGPVGDEPSAASVSYLAETEGKTSLTVVNAVSGATYRIVKVMSMTPTRAAAGDGTPGGIIAYDYVLADGEYAAGEGAEKGRLGDLVKAVIDGGFRYVPGDDGTGVKTAGFDYFAKDGETHVVFRLPDSGKAPEQAVREWEESAEGIAFTEKFADALKAGLDRAGGLGGLAVEVEAGSDAADRPYGATFTPDGGDGDTGMLVMEGLDYGYYMVVSGSRPAMLNIAPGGGRADVQAIYEKHEAPTVRKYVYEDSTGTFEKRNDKAIGDTVMFRAVLDVGTGIRNLKFVDVLPDGMTLEDVYVMFAPRSATGMDLLDKTDGDGKVTLENLLDQGIGTPAAYEALKDYTRKIYLDGNPHDGEMAGGVDLGTLDTNYENEKLWGFLDRVVAVTRPEDSDDGTLTVEFMPEWLMSKRAEKGTSTYGQDPMYPDDDRLHDYTETDHAMYNPYLGDMTTAEDDGGLIVIEYYAKVGKDAAIGGTGNANTAKLVYGNDPDAEGTPTAEDVTRTYVYEMDILKHALGDRAKTLPGAEFTLRRAGNAFEYIDGIDTTMQLLDGCVDKDDGRILALDQEAYAAAVARIKDAGPLKFVKDAEHEDGTYEYRVAVKGVGKDGSLLYEDGASETLVSDAKGRIVIRGLDSDLYELTETEAPSGYIVAEDPAYVVLGSVKSGSAGTSADGRVTMQAYTQDGSTKTRFVQAARAGIDDNIGQVPVANASGLRMPDTGGAGTVMFYVAGAAMVLGSGAVLVMKKRTDRAVD